MTPTVALTHHVVERLKMRFGQLTGELLSLAHERLEHGLWSPRGKYRQVDLPFHGGHARVVYDASGSVLITACWTDSRSKWTTDQLHRFLIDSELTAGKKETASVMD